MPDWFTQLTARCMLLVMFCIFVSPSFAQSLVQTHAQLEHSHIDESNIALKQHLLETTLNHAHFSDHHHDGDHEDHNSNHVQPAINEDGHHASSMHDDTDANGNDLPPHDHDNAHNFIGHVFGHMPVLFSTGFSLHFPPHSQLRQDDTESRLPFGMQDAPFRPPRTLAI